MTERPPRRVRVTSPRARAGRRRQTTITGEIDAQTQIGEVYMRSLVRAQLRLALLVLGAVGFLLAGLPALFAAVPSVRHAALLGLPLPWLLLGVLAHPALAGAGWFYCRQAERTERDFAELVDPTPATPVDRSVVAPQAAEARAREPAANAPAASGPAVHEPAAPQSSVPRRANS